MTVTGPNTPVPVSAEVTVLYGDGSEQVIALYKGGEFGVSVESSSDDPYEFGDMPAGRIRPRHCRYRIVIDADYPSGQSPRDDGVIAQFIYRPAPEPPPPVVTPPPLADRLIGRLPGWLRPFAHAMREMLGL